MESYTAILQDNVETGGSIMNLHREERQRKAEQIQNLREEQQRAEQIQKGKNALQGMM